MTPATTEAPSTATDPWTPNPAQALAWIDKFPGSRLWSKQREIVGHVFDPDNRLTLVQACTGAGKTKIAADIALAWLYTAPWRAVITTAPTARQVRELLWKELRQSVKASEARGLKLGGHLPPTASELRIDDGWLALGFASDGDVNLQGFHSRGGTLIIIDEAVGVSGAVWDALEGTATGRWDRILALANPTTPSGRFFELCRAKASAGHVQISAMDTPNYRAGRVIVPGMTTREFVEDRRTKWGEKSTLWQARILGEFPREADDVLVPLAWIDAAVERGRALDLSGVSTGSIEAGLDVARLGDDSTTLARVRFGTTATVVEPLLRAPKSQTMATVAWAREQAADADVLRVDADGVGAGVYDRLAELDGLPVAVEIRGGRRAMDPTRFVNARSEMLWAVRAALDPASTAPPVVLPPDDALALQASGLKWSTRSDGRVAVESKDDYRHRTGQGSPDELDALAYALARGVGAPVPFVFE